MPGVIPGLGGTGHFGAWFCRFTNGDVGMGYRFDKHQGERKRLALLNQARHIECRDTDNLLGYVADLEWQIHSLKARIEIILTAGKETCPNGLLPDGDTCPRCGCARGPSGVDGGSWVHIR